MVWLQRRAAGCPNSKYGWGPVSPVLNAFVPCFQDGLLRSVPNLVLLLAGPRHLRQLLLTSPSGDPCDRRKWSVKLAWEILGQGIWLVLIWSISVLLAGLAYLEDDSLQDVLFWSQTVDVFAVGLAAAIGYVEYLRSRRSSDLILLFWTGQIAVDAVRLQGYLMTSLYRYNLPKLILFLAGLLFKIVNLGWLLIAPNFRHQYSRLAVDDDIEEEEICPVDDANIFSRLTFGWMTPLMKYGYKCYLNELDLWALRRNDRSEFLEHKFDHYWKKQLTNGRPSLLVALAKSLGRPYALAAVFKFFQDILGFVQPQLLRKLIGFVNAYQQDRAAYHPFQGFAIAGSMFLVSVIQTMFLHQFFQRVFETGMRTKSALTATIYKKSLKLSNDGRRTKSTGDIVNLLTVDAQRLQDVLSNAHILWSAPFQIFLCLASLYQLIGYSMLAGVGIMIIMIPLNATLARIMKKYQKRQMANKDARTRLMSEILNNIKSIKLYAWEHAFMSKLNHIRNDLELRMLRKIGLLDACAVFTWACAPFLVSCSSFAIYVMFNKEPLTAEIVFPALTLFNLLSFPLAVLPQVIISVVEASVAIERLSSFLLSDELQTDAVQHAPPTTRIGDVSVEIKDATFTWSKDDTASLRNINLTAHKGELLCIVGRVGAGKSSMMAAMTGEMHKQSGEVLIKGNIAYASQPPWIMNGTVRDNILFGHKWDPNFYRLTIEACALTDDLAFLPDGDRTEVGEKGISLSGGQKARLGLARAVYARAGVYLLDDILSAVDQHVGKQLLNKVLGPDGLLKTKTRILTTNTISVLDMANTIMMLRDGEIIESGTFAEVMAAKSFIFHLLKDFGRRDWDRDEVPVQDEVALTSDHAELSPSVTISNENIEEQILTRQTSHGTVRRASKASIAIDRRAIADEEGGQLTKREAEHVEQGKVKWDIYREYAKASRIPVVILYLLLLCLSQITSVSGNLWLKHWSEVNGESGENPHAGKYLAIYFTLGVGSAAYILASTIILWVFCAINSAKVLHQNMAIAVLRSPMQFFEVTPIGRIINRFSNDVYKVDEMLVQTFSMFFRNSMRVMFVVIVITYSTPAFLALIIPLACLYLYIQRYYLNTSRELKRLESVTRSPINAHFQESLGGMTTIRAYKQQARFASENEWHVDMNARAYFPLISANRWLAVRLEFIGSLIIFGAATLSVVSLLTTGITAGLVGLALSYALQTTQSLNWIVRQTVEVETNIVSVERILEYSRLPSEAPEIIPNKRPPPCWPNHGEVVFENYSTRYRDNLPLVLHNISLDIRPKEKIGVVGRTGAGKSSLTLALLRIIEPVSGAIRIEGLDTTEIGLLDLRTRLAIIPQDFQLFQGTIRENLDPSGIHGDAALWQALEHSKLKDYVQGLDGQLDAIVREGGSNMSAGQRQLICLARAILNSTKILILDEATAAVDMETDTFIQKTIRQEFKERTLIVIAHRIDTILDSDRIVVMKDGRVEEFDTPANLLSDSETQFYALVKEAGLLPLIST